MQAGIVTVGDELLAGDIENTNATWLARQFAERGVTLREIATVPDEVEFVAETVRRFSDRYDAVVVTGGVGGTPDDVTMDGVAAAFDSELAVRPEARAHVEERVAEVRERRPDFDLDVEAWAATPAAGEPLDNPEGLSPGAVVGNVYVLPGIPDEMKAMFELVDDEFSGEGFTLSFRVEGSESRFVATLREAREKFDARIGCYPTPGGGPKRIVVRGEDRDEVEAAHDWLHAEFAERVVDG